MIHVLNRLGFGPTPENIDRVRRDGLLAYIDEQLHPERIPDSAVAARLAGFETLGKSTRELAEDYFLPAMMERRQQQRRAAQDGTPDNPPPDNTRSRTPEQMETMRMQRAPMAELSQQKILRAAYSDRQLEEVLVDFWFNHFNVFVGQGSGAHLPDRVRARCHPSARVREVPRSARRNREESGDVVLSRQLAEHRAGGCADFGGHDVAAGRRRQTAAGAARAGNAAAGPAAAAAGSHASRPDARRPAGPGATPRPQRELRTRADGAAHAWRRRRLHAEGRPGSRARVHRLDDCGPASGRTIPLRSAPPRRRREARARTADQIRGWSEGRRAGARPPRQTSVDGSPSSPPSWRAGSSRTIRRPRS